MLPSHVHMLEVQADVKDHTDGEPDAVGGRKLENCGVVGVLMLLDVLRVSTSEVEMRNSLMTRHLGICLFQRLVEAILGMAVMLKSFKRTMLAVSAMLLRHSELFGSIYDVRRSFLLPRVKALRLIESILLSAVGEDGLGVASLPDRRPEVCELSEEWEEERLRPSSARMSSSETLRWG